MEIKFIWFFHTVWTCSLTVWIIGFFSVFTILIQHFCCSFLISFLGGVWNFFLALNFINFSALVLVCLSLFNLIFYQFFHFFNFFLHKFSAMFFHIIFTVSSFLCATREKSSGWVQLIFVSNCPWYFFCYLFFIFRFVDKSGREKKLKACFAFADSTRYTSEADLKIITLNTVELFFLFSI